MHEKHFPTLRFMKCRNCGNVFVASLDGTRECPDCSSADTTAYTAEQKDADAPPTTDNG